MKDWIISDHLSVWKQPFIFYLFSFDGFPEASPTSGRGLWWAPTTGERTQQALGNWRSTTEVRLMWWVSDSCFSYLILQGTGRPTSEAGGWSCTGRRPLTTPGGTETLLWYWVERFYTNINSLHYHIIRTQSGKVIVKNIGWFTSTRGWICQAHFCISTQRRRWWFNNFRMFGDVSSHLL